jgi:hypothetical protein
MAVMAANLKANWFTSSYSNDQGGNCVEAARLSADELDADWFKSSYSDNQGGNCVEAARLAGDGAMAVRDSKDPHGPALLFSAAAWTAFADAVRTGELPLSAGQS